MVIKLSYEQDIPVLEALDKIQKWEKESWAE
jgi:hypothetical protein